MKEEIEYLKDALKKLQQRYDTMLTVSLMTPEFSVSTIFLIRCTGRRWRRQRSSDWTCKT